MTVRRARTAAGLLTGLMLSACASAADRMELAEKIARAGGLRSALAPAGAFTLQTWRRLDVRGAPLRVYIEGDGFAWIDRGTVSPDPTPRDPVALRLAARDRAPNVLYVARPCQYLSPPGCGERYWTSHRFAPEVVASVNRAIDVARAAINAPAVELIGYSGGGAVAVLAAARRSDAAAIRTVAGNLDHVALNRAKGVSPLAGSLNAADAAAAVAGIAQIHFVGGDDTVVERFVADGYRRRAGRGDCVAIVVVPGASHEGGWEKDWPRLLAQPPPRC